MSVCHGWEHTHLFLFSANKHAFRCVCLPLCLIFFCAGLSPVSTFRGRPGGLRGVHDDTGAQAAVDGEQRRIPGQHHRQHLLAGERQNFLLPSGQQSVSHHFTLRVIYQFHPLRLLLVTRPHLWLCVSAAGASRTSLSTALVPAGTLHTHTHTQTYYLHLPAPLPVCSVPWQTFFSFHSDPAVN